MRKITGQVVAAAFLTAVAATLVAGTPGAAAQEPLVGICAFPITHDFPKEHIRGHEPPSSSAPFEGFITGQSFVTVTNLENGKSATMSANSAVFFLRDGTAMFRGQSVSFFDSPRGEVPAGVWVISGNVRVTFDAEGRVATAEGGVLRRDICAELA